jgi:hypothetical protein
VLGQCTIVESRLEKMDTSVDTSSAAASAAVASAAAVAAYQASLSEKEQQGYRVAEVQLKTTFDVVKTRGFLEWWAKQTVK